MQDLESESDKGHKENQSLNAQLPTHVEMAAMFAALENSLKTEMATIHNKLGHILTNVEDLERIVDCCTQIIKDLKGEVKKTKNRTKRFDI